MAIQNWQSNGLEKKITLEDYEKALENTIRVREENIEIARENYQIVLGLKSDYNHDKLLHELKYFITKKGDVDYKVIKK